MNKTLTSVLNFHIKSQPSCKHILSQVPEATPSCRQIQSLVSACNNYLELGSFLMRSNQDEALLYGDLYVTLDRLAGVEVDSYGHFFLQASGQQNLALELEGAQTLRFIVNQAKATFKVVFKVIQTRSFLFYKSLDKGPL